MDSTNPNNDDDDDTVSKLIPKSEIQYPQNPRYISKHKPRIRAEITKRKQCHRTLGLPEVNPSNPIEFLKKNTRVEYKIKDLEKHEHVHRPEFRIPLPSWKPIKIKTVKDELPALPQNPLLGARVNYRKKNITDVKVSLPREPKKRYVDTRNGDVHDLKSSGLYPIYINKKNYGKVPKAVKPYHVDGEENNECLPSCRYISQDERQKLLINMKKKWDELMKEFLTLPVVIDTLPKIQRKNKLEHDLGKLEADIGLIERHEHIYVQDNERKNKLVIQI